MLDTGVWAYGVYPFLFSLTRFDYTLPTNNAPLYLGFLFSLTRFTLYVVVFVMLMVMELTLSILINEIPEKAREIAEELKYEILKAFYSH